MEIVLGSGDGAGVRGHATSSGLKLDWSSTSGSSSNWFWSNANRAEGSDPRSLNLTDLNPSDVTLSRVSDPNWGGAIDNLAVTNNATGKTLTITREFSGYSGDGVGSIHFADGTVLDHGQITAAASANLQAGSADVTLNAPDGTATLTAGTGNDMLVGGTGNDTFVYKAIDGNLLIQDHADASQAARSNTLQLTDLNATDISFTQQNNDLVLAIAGTGRAITIAGEFTSADHDGVQQFKSRTDRNSPAATSWQSCIRRPEGGCRVGHPVPARQAPSANCGVGPGALPRARSGPAGSGMWHRMATSQPPSPRVPTTGTKPCSRAMAATRLVPFTKGSLCALVRLQTEDPLSWMDFRSAEQFETQALAPLGVREQGAPV